MVTGADPPAATLLYRVVRALLRPLVQLLFRPTVEGLVHVPDRGPAVLCANHLSVLDPVVVGIVLQRPVVYLAKSEYFRGPSKLLFEHLGVQPVAREGGSAARASIDRGTQVLRDGALLGLYPEGTRSPDGRLYRGKTGSVRLSVRAGAPIIPVALIGTRQAMPPNAWLPRPRPVTVRFGAPLRFDDADGGDVDLRAAADTMMRAIAQLSGQTYVDSYARPVGPTRGPAPSVDPSRRRAGRRSGDGT